MPWIYDDINFWPFMIFFFAMFLLPFVGAMTAAYVWHRRTGMGLHEMLQRMPKMSGPFAMMGHWQDQRHEVRSSGNAAFDAYRQETLDRMEEEFRTFAAFRDRLREAEDRETFDKFMDEMRGSGT